jgi:hypothetical protein
MQQVCTAVRAGHGTWWRCINTDDPPALCTVQPERNRKSVARSTTCAASRRSHGLLESQASSTRLIAITAMPAIRLMIVSSWSP